MIEKWIDKNSKKFVELSDEIWGYSELKFDEYKSAQVLVDLMKNNGFEVREKVGDIETAFICSYGEGQPIIGFLGEYDALDGLSQEANLSVKKPIAKTTSGHGCGHHLLGCASALAATAMKDHMILNKIKGTIRYYGCPGEEGGAGKGFMARRGLFDDLDTAITWHPSTMSGIARGGSLANIQSSFTFNGRSSHAGGAPHLGRSGLDAVELMNIGSNFLREHIIPDARLHYAITDAGGISPNVVQGKAEVLYLVRAPQMEDLKGIYKRVCDIAHGAALMTGTSVDIDFIKATSSVLPNDILCSLVSDISNEINKNIYSNEEIEYAQSFIDTLSEDEKKSSLKRIKGRNLDRKLIENFEKEILDSPIFKSFIPFTDNNGCSFGSTDVGDVSYITPTVECLSACYALGTPGHSWQQVAQGKSTIAHKGLIYAAKLMAKTCEKLLDNPEYIGKAREEFNTRMNGQSYVCPIPEDVQPRKYEAK